MIYRLEFDLKAHFGVLGPGDIETKLEHNAIQFEEKSHLENLDDELEIH